MTRPLILLTNDDGIDSPGLHAAITVLDHLGDLLIVAPTRQQSGMSRSLPSGFDGSIHEVTINHDGKSFQGYHLDGSPAQAVLYGIVEIADRRPDLAISGINYGENLGCGTLISGTVGAALQSGEMGIPSLAVSLETKKEYHYNHGADVDWDAACYWLGIFAERSLEPTAWPQDVAVLKIDVPETATPDTPWRLTTQSRQPYYISRRTKRQTLQDAEVLDYEVGVDISRLEPDSDIYAFVVDRVISVTPLSTDLSARISLPQFEARLRQPVT